MKDKIVIVRTISGEFYIGQQKSDNNDSSITLTNSRVLVTQMTPNGIGISAGFVVPFAIKSPEEITIGKSYIVCIVEEDNIIESILNGYKSQISGIDIVSGGKPSIIC